MLSSLSSPARSTARGLVPHLVLLAIGGPSEAGGPSRPPAARLPAPEHLSATTRAEVRGRMGRHGNTMSSLVRALVLLDRPTISTLAGRIADEEVIARIVEGSTPDKLKTLLPQELFAEQDALQKNRAAPRPPPAGRGQRHGGQVRGRRELCACHSVYLRPLDTPR